jgi:hypothetical protein
MFPNGIIGRLDGPVNGKQHDSAILHITGLLQELETKFVKQDGTWFAFYGDPGYANQKFIKTGFRNSIHTLLTQRQREFNSDMSSLRVSVEYGFGKIIQLCIFRFQKKSKVIYAKYKGTVCGRSYFDKLPYMLTKKSFQLFFCCNPPDLELYLTP